MENVIATLFTSLGLSLGIIVLAEFIILIFSLIKSLKDNFYSSFVKLNSRFSHFSVPILFLYFFGLSNAKNSINDNGILDNLISQIFSIESFINVLILVFLSNLVEKYFKRKVEYRENK